MTTSLTVDVLEDELAVSLARVLATANRTAHQAGREASESQITITQRTDGGDAIWRINYGPQNPVGRRGGDLIVDVNSRDATFRQVLRGQ